MLGPTNSWGADCEDVKDGELEPLQHSGPGMDVIVEGLGLLQNSEPADIVAVASASSLSGTGMGTNDVEVVAGVHELLQTSEPGKEVIGEERELLQNSEPEGCEGNGGEMARSTVERSRG